MESGTLEVKAFRVDDDFGNMPSIMQKSADNLRHHNFALTISGTEVRLCSGTCDYFLIDRVVREKVLA